MKDKKKKKHSWSNKGGHVAPIFVPPTPNSELASMLKDVVDRESEGGVSFKIVETGGKTVKTVVQKSNPTATAGCTDLECIACRQGRGEGGNCRGSGINYEVECQMCPDGERSKYIGESSRNLFTRGREHERLSRNRSKKSFMRKHQQEKHQSRGGEFTAKVTGSARDCLTRQVREAVEIRRCPVTVMNSKSEWHQPALWQVQNEIYRG